MINPLKNVEVNRFILRHPRIAPEFEGFVIAQITDVHLGPWIKPRHLDQIVAFVNDQQPSLVALTGDYVGYNKKSMEPCIHSLAGLEAPAYAVLGNHDHWTSRALAEKAFEAVEIPLLSNECVDFEWRDGHALCVVGVDDAVTKHADVDRAFGEVDDSKFCLTLNHVPAIAWDCADAGAHLILSGHTHGFQFNIPRITHAIAERFGTKLFAGPYRLDNAMLYISRGLGSSSWPRRFRAQSELTFFTLEPGAMPEFELVDSSTLNIEHRP